MMHRAIDSRCCNLIAILGSDTLAHPMRDPQNIFLSAEEISAKLEQAQITYVEESKQWRAKEDEYVKELEDLRKEMRVCV